LHVEAALVKSFCLIVILNFQERAMSRFGKTGESQSYLLKGDREKYPEAGGDSSLAKSARPAEAFAALEELALRANGAPQPDPVPETGTATVFDHADLVDRLGGDELVERFVRMFIGIAASRLEKLKHALLGADKGEVQMQTHALKGASANISAPRMCGIAEVMEERARDGRLEGVQELLAELEAAFADFVEVTAQFQE
jgi:HPt (histidine-containing phosphotransfer) domain-containing protein